MDENKEPKKANKVSEATKSERSELYTIKQFNIQAKKVEESGMLDEEGKDFLKKVKEKLMTHYLESM